MNILLAWCLLSFIATIFIVTPPGRRWLKWVWHGDCIQSFASPLGTLREYSDGYIELETHDGDVIDVEFSLYDAERDWQLCGTRYGENGTVTRFYGAFLQMAAHVESKCGVITFVDIVTGLVHYRAFE